MLNPDHVALKTENCKRIFGIRVNNILHKLHYLNLNHLVAFPIAHNIPDFPENRFELISVITMYYYRFRIVSLKIRTINLITGWINAVNKYLLLLFCVQYICTIEFAPVNQTRHSINFKRHISTKLIYLFRTLAN